MRERGKKGRRRRAPEKKVETPSPYNAPAFTLDYLRRIFTQIHPRLIFIRGYLRHILTQVDPGQVFTRGRLRHIFTQIRLGQVFTRSHLRHIFTQVDPGQVFTRGHLRRVFTQIRLRDVLSVIAAILIFLTTIAASKLLDVYGRYAAIVDKQLNQQSLQRHAGVYAAPRRVSIEQPISRKELRERLLRAGYQQSETGQPEREADPLSSGSFVFNGDTAELRTNEFARPGSLPKTVKIRFSKPAGSGERILAIEDAATGQELKSADLAPELITVDGVTMMHPRSQARFDDFPPALVKALLSIEDRHFFSHRGIDVKAVCRAMWENWRHGEIREGGSTITQQLIKTSFLTPERTYERKFTEALMAVAIERRLSKVEIFTIYADRVYLGQSGLTGVYGFKQAARVFFDKDLSELSLAESALIAGLAQAPNRYSPYLNPDAALGRRNTVLDAMVETSEISAAEAEAAKSEKLEVLPPAQPDESAAQHFVDYLKRELTGRKISEKDQPNLKIQTTLDLDLQQAANSAVKNHLKKLDRVFGPRASGAKTKDDPHKTALAEAALIAIDPRTGEILAMVGGRDYASSQLNRVTDARRQPGSVFKPIVYAAALAQGMSPETIFDDTPHEFIFGRDIYRPQNYGGGFSNRLVTLREGIVRSLNVVAVDAAMRVGLPKVADIAQKMGLPRPEAYPSMALGAFEATPFEIAEAYSTFANDGVSVAPFGIKSVTSATAPGVQNTGTKTRVLNSSTAYIVTETLADVINHGTASQVRAMGYHGPAAGKTGSSRDAWFAGYTPNMLVVVWVGFDDHRDLKMTGGGAAVPIWTDFVKRALAARPDLKAREFTPPTGSELVEIDTETGMLASENCPSRKSVVIDISKMPPYCFKHQTIRATEATGARIGRKKYSVLAGNPRQRSARKVNQAPDTDSARDPYLKPMSDGVELLPRLQPLTTRRQFEMAPKGRPFRVVGPILPGSTSQKPETRKEEPPRRDYR